MDDITASLILKLQLEDADELIDSDKGKQAGGPLADADHALVVYKEELQRLETVLSDRRMGRSISEAVERDAEHIRTARVEEQNAIRDHRLACSIGGLGDTQKLIGDPDAYVDVDDQLVRQLSRLNVSREFFDLFEGGNLTEEGSSSRITGNKAPVEIQRRLCIACQETKHTFDVLETPCRHIYCRRCIFDLFEASTTDESLFPPRCCRQNIALSMVSDFLTTAFIIRFKEKAVEFTTPDRMYCAQPTCSTFIPPSQIAGDTAHCPSCKRGTCVMCKSVSHEGDCPNDTALQELLATAAEVGWQRCHACRRVVELNLGCNHMTWGKLVKCSNSSWLY